MGYRVQKLVTFSDMTSLFGVSVSCEGKAWYVPSHFVTQDDINFNGTTIFVAHSVLFYNMSYIRVVKTHL